MSFWDTLGDVAEGVGGFIGNILGINSDQEIASQNNATALQIADMQRQQSDFYAQNGIAIKANDARRAGVNVNAALGAQTSMPSWSSPQLMGVSTADRHADAGRSLGQVIERLSSKEEKVDEMSKLALERARLENDLLRSQISITKSPGRSPPLPSAVDTSAIPGQGNNYLVKPAEVTASSRMNPGHEAGAINEMAYARDSKGRVRPIMSSDYKQRSEDDLMSTWDWNIRNRVLSWWSGPSKPTFSAGRGRHWEWDVGAQAYVSVPNPQSNSLASPGPTPYNKSYRRK